MNVYIFVIILLIGLVNQALGHGRLMEPVGRSSAWRLGFNVPRNYDDNALFCGGFATQQNNGGRCGVCGDPYNGKRENEPPHGKYATGTIVRTYKEGQVITTRAQITANHNGWMEYRICPHNDVTTPVTQECLDKYVLQRADGKGSKIRVPPSQTGLFTMDYKLPDGVTCTQCVIQWKYHAGNSWGVDRSTGAACMGCGPQEEFFGCADVAIQPRVGPVIVPIITAPAPVVTQAPLTTTPPRPSPRVTNAPPATQTNTGVCHAINNWAGDLDMNQWCIENCAIGNCPPYGCDCGGQPTTARPTTTSSTSTTSTTTTPTTTTSTTTTPSTTTSTTRGLVPTEYINKVVCKAVNLWAGNEYLDRWCADACAKGNCPDDSCKCSLTSVSVSKATTEAPQYPMSTNAPQTTKSIVQTVLVCKAISVWEGIEVFDKWCSDECAKDNCPTDTCNCTGTPLFPLNKTTPPPTTTTTTKQTTPPIGGTAVNKCVSNGIVGGDYWDNWCQKNCDRDYCAVDYCFCN